MSIRKPFGRPNKGLESFSLIEMLVGLGIFSVIALSLYSTFSSGFQIDRRSEDINGVYREARLAFDMIAQDLERAVWYDFSNSDPQKKSFLGDKDKISFIVPAGSGLKTVSYFLQALDFGSVYMTLVGNRSVGNTPTTFVSQEKIELASFVREEKSFLDNFAVTLNPKSEKEILTPHVKRESLEFSYAYLEGEGSAAKIVYKDKWQMNYLPLGVRLKMIFVKPDKTRSTVTMTKNIFIPTGFLGQEGSGIQD